MGLLDERDGWRRKRLWGLIAILGPKKNKITKILILHYKTDLIMSYLRQGDHFHDHPAKSVHNWWRSQRLVSSCPSCLIREPPKPDGRIIGHVTHTHVWTHTQTWTHTCVNSHLIIYNFPVNIEFPHHRVFSYIIEKKVNFCANCGSFEDPYAMRQGRVIAQWTQNKMYLLSKTKTKRQTKHVVIKK